MLGKSSRSGSLLGEADFLVATRYDASWLGGRSRVFLARGFAETSI